MVNALVLMLLSWQRKTNGWTELCIHRDHLHIQHVYLYNELRGEKTASKHEHPLLVFMHSLLFILPLTKPFPLTTIKDASSFVSEPLSHDLRIIAAMLQNKKPNGAVICRKREASITLRPERRAAMGVIMCGKRQWCVTSQAKTLTSSTAPTLKEVVGGVQESLTRRTGK